MVMIAACEKCKIVHKETYWSKYDEKYLALVAYHSERKSGHDVSIQFIEAIDDEAVIDEDLRHFPSGFTIGYIETALYMTA